MDVRKPQRVRSRRFASGQMAKNTVAKTTKIRELKVIAGDGRL
jgi:hypothetical protein